MTSAEVLLKGGRYTHCVFFCHLSVEKALKAAYLHKLTTEPPKTHNLVFLLSETGISLPDDMQKFVDRLATASVPTRYPEDLRLISRRYTKETTPEILSKSREALVWIKELLKK